MSDCPCGSGRNYSECCEPLHNGAQAAASAEALMRSRYSAYVKGQIGYLGESLHPDHRDDYDEQATRRWAQKAEWTGLEVRSTEAGSSEDEAVVEFVANYRENGKPHRHHEFGHFVRNEGRWYYLDGSPPKLETVVNDGPKVGRNDPCPCGSGKKYKKCCGA
jgi:SEC-C motif-containing protein